MLTINKKSAHIMSVLIDNVRVQQHRTQSKTNPDSIIRIIKLSATTAPFANAATRTIPSEIQYQYISV